MLRELDRGGGRPREAGGGGLRGGQEALSLRTETPIPSAQAGRNPVVKRRWTCIAPAIATVPWPPPPPLTCTDEMKALCVAAASRGSSEDRAATARAGPGRSAATSSDSCTRSTPSCLRSGACGRSDTTTSWLMKSMVCSAATLGGK